MGATSENPFRRDFWLGWVDPRPLALFRVGFGLVLLHDLVDLSRDARAFFSDDGMLPRLVAQESPFSSLVNVWPSSPAAVSLVLALGAGVVLCFTAGFFTRFASAAAFAFYWCLHNRNLFVTDGGDDLIRILLFWSSFADLGAVWSVDAWRRGGQVRYARAFGLRFLQLHVAVFYFVAARLKWRLGWFRGLAIFQTLQLVGFVRPPGALLGTMPAVCTALTFFVLGLEVSFPFLAFSPFWVRTTRALAIACGLLVQGGILVAMRVGVFTETMIVVNVLWLLPEWLDGVPLLRLPAGEPTTPPPPQRPELALFGLLALQFTASFWGFFAGRRFPLPRAVNTELRDLGLVQPADLFGTTYDVPRWYADGVLADGRVVDVLAAAQPELRPGAPSFRFSRWYKFTFKDREHPIHFDTLSAYLCTRYDEVTSGPKLASFTLYKLENKPRVPGDGAPPPPTRILLRDHRCNDLLPNPENADGPPAAPGAAVR